MNAAQNIAVDAGLVRGASEVVALDFDTLNGQAVVTKAGVEYPFPTANLQSERRVVQLRLVRGKDVGLTVSGSILLTLRDPVGRYIVQDLPLRRVAEENVKGWIVRNLIYRPTLIDWRQCFAKAVDNTVSGIMELEIIYEPTRA